MLKVLDTLSTDLGTHILCNSKMRLMDHTHKVENKRSSTEIASIVAENPHFKSHDEILVELFKKLKKENPAGVLI